MRNLKRIGAMLMALVMAFSLRVTAFAAVEDTGFADVAADAWYAEAVEYVRDNELMNGTSDTTFAPDDTVTRSMLAATLYREDGSLAVSGSDAFTDTQEGAWYADAVLWAFQEGVISGYGDGLFGTNDPVSREQIATILWRYAGSPSADAGRDFADESKIDSYAVAAVDWARANGVVNGADGNRFLPQNSASRAEVATMLYNFLTMDGTEKPEQLSDSPRVLVAYFSATGNTESVANTIADLTGGDLFEITPADPYTSDDLNWTDENSRVVYEYENPEARDIELADDTVDNWDEYDVVFIGYSIWWGIAAWPTDSFVEANDFNGKTVIPFCTSSSSGLGQSGELLAELAGTGDWQEGQRFRGSASETEIQTWLDSLKL